MIGLNTAILSGGGGAGLERGDIITVVDGDAIASMGELAAETQQRRPGETSSYLRLRGDQTR